MINDDVSRLEEAIRLKEKQYKAAQSRELAYEMWLGLDRLRTELSKLDYSESCGTKID